MATTNSVNFGFLKKHDVLLVRYAALAEKVRKRSGKGKDGREPGSEAGSSRFINMPLPVRLF